MGDPTDTGEDSCSERALNRPELKPITRDERNEEHHRTEYAREEASRKDQRQEHVRRTD
ncbi:hypothetical protein GCM10008985_04070 [Halococcus dombrowskii]|uniref:Uncharacterized protein n=1 Tax=Halococcus dombrowskii TaxID=179637 RepID=A0AAV3SD91_HALDO